jgi:hypothetical protein
VCVCVRSSSPPQFLSPIQGLQADRQCLGGGIRLRGVGYHAPTPQAGRVTDSHGGGGGMGVGGGN